MSGWGRGRRGGRTQFHKGRQKKITFQPVYQSAKERRGGEDGGEREGEEEIQSRVK